MTFQIQTPNQLCQW